MRADDVKRTERDHRIRELRKREPELTQREIGKRFGITAGRVSQIVNGRARRRGRREGTLSKGATTEPCDCPACTKERQSDRARHESRVTNIAGLRALATAVLRNAIQSAAGEGRQECKRTPEQDREWLLDPRAAAPWAEMAGLDWDAVVSRLRARGVLREAA